MIIIHICHDSNRKYDDSSDYKEASFVENVAFLTLLRHTTKRDKKMTFLDLATFSVIQSDSTASMAKYCKAETWGMEHNRDRVIQWKWMALTPTHHWRGESLKKRAVKGRKEGGNDWRLCGKREEGLKKYELVYDLAAENIKKGKRLRARRDKLFVLPFAEDE